MTERKHLSIEDFRNLGYLQEVNRIVLHPCGLAMSVEIDDKRLWYRPWKWGRPRVTFGPVFDSRDDPEGFVFHDLTEQESKTKFVLVGEEMDNHRTARVTKFGWLVQPMNTKLDL